MKEFQILFNSLETLDFYLKHNQTLNHGPSKPKTNYKTMWLKPQIGDYKRSIFS